MTALGGQHNGSFDRLQIAAQLLIPALSKPFQIQIDGIYLRQQGAPRFLLDGAVGHQHIE